MERIEDLVPRIQTLLKTMDPGEAALVYGDGRIEVTTLRAAESPDRAGDGPDPIARFVAGSAEVPDQEIEDRIKTGMAGSG